MSPAVKEFRTWLRTQLERPAWRKRILDLAKEDTRLLQELIRQAHGAAPAKVTVDIPDGLTVYTATTADGDPAFASPEGLPARAPEGDGT